ncbi:MAG: hypothetical protein CSA74_09260 [Rhodobacterales bacterium]|nr:MAG: hypothetical protein CSA74_09260 [Rhodobacterales bacterium]
MQRDEQDPGTQKPDETTYTRREALAALAKYTAAGGAATTIVTAEGLVSEASAYPWPCWLDDWCRRHPNSRLCRWDGWNSWGWGGKGWDRSGGHGGISRNGSGNGNANGRIRY